MKITFGQQGDFEAFNAAHKWCDGLGISVGSSQRGEPIGLLVGRFSISKWRNMTVSERAALDGTITGDTRNGPVVVHLRQQGLDKLAMPGFPSEAKPR